MDQDIGLFKQNLQEYALPILNSSLAIYSEHIICGGNIQIFDNTDYKNVALSRKTI